MSVGLAARRRRRFVALWATVLGLGDVVQAAAHTHIARLGALALPLGGTTRQILRYLLLLAGLGILCLIRGLLRGKRSAWVLGLLGAGASLIGHHVVKADVIGSVAALGFLALLIMNAPLFRARSDPALARRSVVFLLVGLLGSYVYGVVGLYLLDSQFRRSTTLADAFRASTRLLFLRPVRTIEPVTRHGRWFIDSVRVVVVVVLVVSVVGILRPVRERARHSSDLARVRRILAAFANSPLAEFHLLDDKHHLFAADDNAFLGYKVVRSVAVCLGGPIGDEQSFNGLIEAFLEHCELNGWIPAFHQATPDEVDRLSRFGLKALKIGEEAIVDVGSFSLLGSHFKSMRSKVGRMEREGWRVEELMHPIAVEDVRRLREISDAWLRDGGHRERTFTVGQFSDESISSTVVLAARDPSGVIRGFTNVLPAYRCSDGNFDMMRRDPTSKLPVMDFLFVHMIERFRREGMTGMTLGLAPFANVDGDTVADRALRTLYDRGGKAFNFTGLRAFKEKWRPRWEPRYLVYRSESQLPEIAFGVSRAGELPAATSGWFETASGSIGMIGRATIAAGRRVPFTIFIITVIVAVELSTAFDRDGFDRMQQSLHYNWADIVDHYQLYRIATALFVQDGPGLRIGIVFLVPLLAIGEFLLRTRKAAVAFFAGDLVSTFAVLLASRVMSAFGSVSAERFLLVRDGGVSSAMFAVIAGAVTALPWRTVRRAAAAALAMYFVLSGLLEQRPYSVQHPLAAIVGVACVSSLYRPQWLLRRRNVG